MSKFLELVEENTPGAGVGPFTVEYKDAEGTVMSILTIPDDVGSSYENFLDFAKGSGGSLEVVDQPVSIEDNEFLQAQAADDPAGPAAAALEDRQATADAIIAAFIADTEQMKQAADGSGGAAVAPAGGGSFGSSQ